MRVLKWRRKTLVSLATVLGVCCYFLIALMDDMTCSKSNSLHILHRLCDDYQKGLIAGNICPNLCDDKSITFQKCTNYKDGKKVLLAKWHGETIILKSKKAHWSDYDSIDAILESTTVREFMNMVKESVSLTLEINVEDFPKLNQQDTSVLTELWSMDFKDYTGIRTVGKGIDDSKTQAAMRSLWSLLQQNEYVMLKFLRNRRHIPDVAGTCGHFYAMEYLPHGPGLDPEVLEVTGLTDEVPWMDRLRVGVSLLEALKSYDEEYHQTLHLCDVKGPNFGMSEAGVAKILDLDNAFFTKRLEKELSSQSCSSHAHCDFFDCHGYCNLTTGQCTAHRTNNNLQVLCEKIFQAKITNKYLGLLRKPPQYLDEQLGLLLGMCVDANDVNKPLTQHHASVRILDRIYNLLQKDLISYRHPFLANE